MNERKDADGKRYAVLVHPNVQKDFAALAKKHGVSQSVVAETLLEIVERDKLDNALTSKYADKITSRSSKTSLLKRLAGLNAEQLADLLSKAGK